PNIVFVAKSGEEFPVDADVGANLMQAALRSGVPGIEGACGGALVCATCVVSVPQECWSRMPEAEPKEAELLGFCDLESPAFRLACQVRLSESLTGTRF